MKKGYKIQLQFDLPASPDDVFNAFTNSELIQVWSKKEGFVEPRIGGKLSYFDGQISGIVKEYDPGYYLGYTIRETNWADDWEDSMVEYSFTPKKNGSGILILHRDLPNEEALEKWEVTWNGLMIPQVRSLFELTY
ncbi:MAG: SRPBCC domain-containing protein [Bacteroidia bacterium]